MNIMDYIKPELLILAVICYIIGAVCKRVQLVPDKLIPLVLGAVGVVLACLWVGATSDMSTSQNVMMAIFTGVTQGILCAGASVYVNQLIKQSGKKE